MSIPRVRVTSDTDPIHAVEYNKTTYREANRMYYNPVTALTWDDPQTLNYSAGGTSKMTVDRVTPNFKKLSKEGKIINNPLSILEESNIDPLVTLSTIVTDYRKMMSIPNNYKVGIYPYQIDSWTGHVPASAILSTSGTTHLPPLSTVDVENVASKAVTKAWANVNESDMLILASVAESSKSAKDLHLLARKVLRAIKFIRHPVPPKNFTLKRAKKWIEESEELYMQARYNLRPLYYDILGVMKVTSGVSDAKRAHRNVMNRYTIRGYETDSASNTDEVIAVSSLLPFTSVKIVRTSTEFVEARAGVLCQARDMTRWEQSGIYLLPETAWELVPFSFIIDWFTNFGDLISSWSPKPGVDPLTSWVTVERTITQQMAISVESVTNVYPHSETIGLIWERITEPTSLNVTIEKVTREKTRTPNPGRSFTPSFDINLDALKIIDLAIIGKNLSKSTKRYRI